MRRINTKALTITVAAAALIAVAGTGTAVAGGLITGKDIANDTITGKDVKNLSLGFKDFTPNVQEKILDNKGATGATGAQGVPGEQGKIGPQGPQGPQGPKGERGADGADGTDGRNGTDGTDGEDGLSAFQQWLRAGHGNPETSTPHDMFQWLKGEDGRDGQDGADAGISAAGAGYAGLGHHAEWAPHSYGETVQKCKAGEYVTGGGYSSWGGFQGDNSRDLGGNAKDVTVTVSAPYIASDADYSPISDADSRFFADRWVVRGFNDSDEPVDVRAWVLCAPIPAS